MDKRTWFVLFDLHVLALVVSTLDTEKVRQAALEDNQGCKPKEEDVPHANKSAWLDDAVAAEKDVVIVVVAREHDHVSDHTDCLENVKHKDKYTKRVALVSLDGHLFFGFKLCQVGRSVIIFQFLLYADK